MSHPSSFHLDRLVAKELDASELLAIQQHVDACPGCQAYLTQRHQEQGNLKKKHPAPAFVRALQKPPTTKPLVISSRIWMVCAAGVAATALVLIFVFRNIQSVPPEDSLRWRGLPPLVRVFRMHQGGSTILGEQAIQVGDTLRFEITMPPDQQGFAVLLAREGERIVPLLSDPNQIGPHPVSGQTFLPGSVVVEADQQHMEILLIVRPDRFDLDVITDQAQRALNQNLQNPTLSGLLKRWPITL